MNRLIFLRCVSWMLIKLLFDDSKKYDYFLKNDLSLI
jgi:hypothetical protein